MRRSPRLASMSAVTSPVRSVLALVALVSVVSMAAVVVLPSSAHATTHRQARAATSVSGWTSSPLTVGTGTAYVAHVRVSGGIRSVQLQRRTGSAWRTVSAARSARTGATTLTWRAPAAATTVALRLRVVRTARSAAAVTPLRVVRVVAQTTPDSPNTPDTPDTPTGPEAPTVPVLTPVLAEVLVLVNQARATGRTCGSVHYPAVGALTADARLAAAADAFALQMGTEGFFSHTSPDGSTPGDRIEAEGYDWRAYGENIAAGQTTAVAVVTSWLGSTGHCKNIMNGAFREIGLGHAEVAGSPYGTYWVQDFASPR